MKWCLTCLVFLLGIAQGRDLELESYVLNLSKAPDFKLCYDVVIKDLTGDTFFSYRAEHLRTHDCEVFRKYLNSESGEYLSVIVKSEGGVVKQLHQNILTVSGDARKIPELKAYYRHSPIYYLPLYLNSLNIFGINDLETIVKVYNNEGQSLKEISQLSFYSNAPCPKLFSIKPDGQNGETAIFGKPKLLGKGFWVPESLTIKANDHIMLVVKVDFTKSRIYEGGIDERMLQIPKTLIKSVKDLDMGVHTQIQAESKEPK